MADVQVSDLAAAMAFGTGPLGFGPAFARPAQQFACLAQPDGAQTMICARDGDRETGPMERPHGRGAIIQIPVDDVRPVHAAVVAVGHPLTVDLCQKWRDRGDRQGGQRACPVQGPDGCLLMVAQRPGERSWGGGPGGPDSGGSG